MVYTLAAYTITLGSLAIYLALQQHRARTHAHELATATGQPPADPRTGFNAGAALLAPFWMLCHGLALPGAILLIPCLAVVPLYLREMWIPLAFVAMVPIAAAAALGFVGNRIGVAHLGVEDPAAFSATQLPWTVAGIVVHVLVLPWVVWLGLGTT